MIVRVGLVRERSFSWTGAGHFGGLAPEESKEIPNRFFYLFRSSYSRFSEILESLILAQDERWRRA
jgi:hypothetical protein